MTETTTQTPQKCLENKLKEIVEAEPNHRTQESQAWELIRTDMPLWEAMRDELVRRGLQAMLEDIRKRRTRSLKDNPPPDPDAMRNRQSRLDVQDQAIEQQRLWDLARLNGKPFRLATKEDLVYTKKHLSAEISGLNEKLTFVDELDKRVPEGEVQDHMTADEFRRLWKENYGPRDPSDVGF